MEHAKFVAEAEKRAAAGGAEAERLRAALAEAERAAAAAAGAQRGAEARAGAAEQEARERVADLEVRPPAALHTLRSLRRQRGGGRTRGAGRGSEAGRSRARCSRGAEGMLL